MKQVKLQDPHNIVSVEVEPLELPAGWVQIRTVCCGICGSDIHAYSGETIFGKIYPFHIGHEVVGYVEKCANENSPFKKGDLVTLNPFFTCNSCDSCYNDRSNDCQNRTTIGLKGPGGFSEFVFAPETSVYKAVGEIAPERLCLAEPIANVIYAIDRIRWDNKKRILINGVGAIGLVFLQLLKGYYPTSITVCDLNTEKLEQAKKLGVTKAALPSEMGDDVFDVIIDCTGSAKCVGDSIHKLAFGGQLVSFGVCHSEATFEANPFELYKKDATIISTFALNKSSMQKSINLLSNPDFNTDVLIDSVQPLDKLEESIIKMKEGRTKGKIVINTTL